MTLLNRIEQTTQLWATMLPQIPAPEASWIGRWCAHPDEAIEHAIIRASKKFASSGPPAELVWRYVSGVINNEVAGKQQRSEWKDKPMTDTKTYTKQQLATAERFTGIASALMVDAKERGGNSPQTTNQLIEGMDNITEWISKGKSSDKRALLAVSLAETLFYDYQKFHSRFLEVISEDQYADDPRSQKLGELLRSGKLTGQTTFAELAQIIDAATDVNEAA